MARTKKTEAAPPPHPRTQAGLILFYCQNPGIADMRMAGLI
jgi:hypothetical protein